MTCINFVMIKTSPREIFNGMALGMAGISLEIKQV